MSMCTHSNLDTKMSQIRSHTIGVKEIRVKNGMFSCPQAAAIWLS